jgi:hypothetical protein
MTVLGLNRESPADRRTTWRTMLLLRENLRWYNLNNKTGEYNDAILRYNEIYQDYLKEFLTKNNQHVKELDEASN